MQILRGVAPLFLADKTFITIVKLRISDQFVVLLEAVCFNN
ncbi:hypothetical protein V512_000295 [Mesotoga sp. Brook.08.105.5.1]|jgi:Mlc titration factor MtfA (ptsG expression regulator)|nr:hypothetical protein V512_000295 [Mesotoga sp. Brook.08.105.5.1]